MAGGNPSFEGRLDDRVVRALAEQPGRQPFVRLRRSLGAHPESLTRTLRRLERLGTVGHDGQGYFLLEGAESMPRGRSEPATTELVSIRLAPSLSPDSVLGLVAGRWFGDLRWAGSRDEGAETALAWELPGVAGLLLLRCRGGQLTISAERPGGGAPDPRLVPAAEELLYHTLGRLRPWLGGDRAGAPRSDGGMAQFARDPSSAPRPIWAA